MVKITLEDWQVKNLRDYFEHNDKIQKAHWAYEVFNKAYKEQCTIPDVVGQSEQLFCKCGFEKKGNTVPCIRPDCDNLLNKDKIMSKEQDNQEENKALHIGSVSPRFSKKALISRNDPLIKQLQALALRFRDEHEDQEGFQKLDGVIYNLLTLTNEG